MSMDENDNKPKRSFDRSMKDFESLSSAENKLIDYTARGEMCVLGESVPIEPTPDNRVRPDLIRFLALGGDNDTHVCEKGVKLRGAWIGEEALDFDGASLETNLWLIDCRFKSQLTFRNARARSLNLKGSFFPGINASQLKLDGELSLKRVHSKGLIRLYGAEIGGDFDCSGGRFEGVKIKDKGVIAIVCDGTRIGLSVRLGEFIQKNGNYPFHAIGEVRFLGVTIKNDLVCCGGKFENENGAALACERANIGDVLFFREGVSAKGDISFAHATVGTLADDINCWPDKSLDLDGFRYERIAATSPLDAKSRIAWLDKQKPEFLTGDKLALQPWIHLAKVLREQGHFREAAEVDIAREERLRKAKRVADPIGIWQLWSKRWGRVDIDDRYVSFFSICFSIHELIVFCLHWFYGLISGYGHRPMRIVYAAIFLWFSMAGVFSIAADYAIFAPSNAATAKTLREDCANQFAPEKIDWTRCAALQETYPRFSPWAYSLDLILPVARLGQSTSWTPISDGGWLSLSGWTQRLVWIEEVFGWVAALTLAAIATGLVKRKDG